MKRLFGPLLVLATAAAAPLAASAQTATIYGSLGNFDIMNNAGEDAHGFEIELEGVQAGDVPYTFSVQRYGPARIIASATGVRVRWESPYDAASGQFTQTTMAHRADAAFVQGSCYQWNGSSYDNAGCEHFGASLLRNATATTYRWLVADPAQPGALRAVTLASPVASPVYYIAPPARPADPPVLVAEVPAPEPADSPERYGDAQWMKTFKTELRREVTLDELLTDNPLVPQDAAHLETEWELMQDTPNVEGKQKRNGRFHQGALDAATRAVVRRFEIYQFTGAYDPITHQAICADLTCTAPAAEELGEFVSAQMDAANVRVPSVSVSIVGAGSVSSLDRAISCGSRCSTFVQPDAPFTLTASANSGTVFKGWSGGCSGVDATCVLSVNEHTDVTATFAQVFKVGVSKSKTGTVTANVVGIDGALSCGSDCTTTYAAGTTVTLTAVAAAGKQFVNWSGGACGGSTAPVCTFVVSKDISIQPVFSK